MVIYFLTTSDISKICDSDISKIYDIDIGD